MAKKKPGRPQIFEGVKMSSVSLTLPTEVVNELSRQSVKTDRSVSTILRDDLWRSAWRLHNVVSSAACLRRARNRARAEAKEADISLQSVLSYEYISELQAQGWHIEMFGTDYDTGRLEITIRSGQSYLMPIVTDEMLDLLGVHENTNRQCDSSRPSFVKVIGLPTPSGHAYTPSSADGQVH
jgi:hypothetical protein